jgi:hypothetical protein
MPRDRRRPSAPRCVVRIRRLDPVGVAMFIPHLTDLLPSLTGSTAATRNAAVLQRCVPNVQAFIRRASSMADKTSWTKPLACMTYGDSIVGRARVSLGTVYPATTVRCSSGWPGTRTAAAVAARHAALRAAQQLARQRESRQGAQAALADQAEVRRSCVTSCLRGTR